MGSGTKTLQPGASTVNCSLKTDIHAIKSESYMQWLRVMLMVV